MYVTGVIPHRLFLFNVILLVILQWLASAIAYSTLGQILRVNTPADVIIFNKNLKITNYSYVWELQNFANYHPGIGEFVKSSTFNIDDRLDGFLALYPDGIPKNENDREGIYIALFFDFGSTTSMYVLQSDLKIKLQLTMTPPTNDPSTTKEIEITSSTHKKGLGWGFEQFSKRESTWLRNGHRSLSLPIEFVVTVVYDNSLPAPLCNLDSQSQLNKDFGAYKDNEAFSDVTLVVGAERFRAHKVILAARSPVFKTMFTSDMVPDQSDQVIIKDLEKNVLKSVLTYMYTDQAPDLDVMAEELMAAADKYQLDDLKAKCGETLARKLTIDNAADTLILASRHNAIQLMANLVEFVNRNRNDVIASEGWQRAKKSHANVLVVAFL